MKTEDIYYEIEFDNELIEFYRQEQERNLFLQMIEDRHNVLKHEICPICGHRGLDATGFDTSVCLNCNTEHNI